MEFPKSFKNEELNKKWIELKKIRDVCNISIEEKRTNKEIGSSLEASLTINLNKKIFDLIEDIDFAELCITSYAQVLETELDEIVVSTTKAEGKKCSVCWKINKNECKRHPV